MASLESDIIKYRKIADELFVAGVKAADPDMAVAKNLSVLFKDNPNLFSKITVVGVGKASIKMMHGALSVLPRNSLARDPLVITNAENMTKLDGVDVMQAGHPLPDIDGFQAATRLAELADSLQASDTLLMLISGGASAMLPLPVRGVSLEDKISTTQSLLACGADINTVNMIRKHLSQLKGGGLVRLASPARVVALILSDVIGDDLSAIASGLTAPDLSSANDVVSVLRKLNLWDDLPQSVRTHLDQVVTGMVVDTLKAGDKLFDHVENYLVGTNTISVRAMGDLAHSMGLDEEVLEDAIVGEARTEADRLARMVKEIFLNKKDNIPLVFSAGGETTVTLSGNGKGGRNQELALAFAIAAELYDVPPRWVFLSAGTDGRDGPTDAAGAIVDPWTLSRIRAKGHSARAHLNNNDAYHALLLSDDLMITNGTGTNVADLQLLILL